MHTRHWPWPVAALMAAALAVAAPPDAGSGPLERPARPSGLASRGVLLALTASPDEANWLAAGERGHILTSADRGKTWAQASVPVAVTLTAIRMAGKGQAVAVGHGLSVLRSADGGRTWARQTDGRQLSPAFRDLANQAKQSGRSKLADKLERLANEGADKPLLDVLMLDESNGLAVGAYGVVLKTQDGGRQWRGAFELLPDDEDRHINVIRQIGRVVWMAGERGLLYRSDDLGRHFVPVDAGTKSSVFTLAGAGDTVMVAGLRGSVSVSTDGGQLWQAVQTNSTYSFTAGALESDTQGNFILADDSGGIWRLDGRHSKAAPLRLRARFPIADFHIDPERSLAVVGLLGVEMLGPLPAATK